MDELDTILAEIKAERGIEIEAVDEVPEGAVVEELVDLDTIQAA